MNLVDDHLPSQAAYIAGLRRRGLLPHWGVTIPWRVMQVLFSILGAALTLCGLGARRPEILLRSGFAARLKPFRFSNSRAKDLLNWIPGREFA